MLPDGICIVELNPYGENAGGGFFKWNNEKDKKTLQGEAPFDFRITTAPIPPSSSFVGWSELVKKALHYSSEEQQKKEKDEEETKDMGRGKDRCIIS